MVRRIASTSIVAATALGACFGAGPTPSSPTGVTVLFGVSVPGDCNSESSYIGAVAIGSGSQGYVTELPYFPRNCSSNNGGNQGSITAPASIFAFDKATGTLAMLDSAGVGLNDLGPRIAATGSGAVWAYSPDASGSAVDIGPGSAVITPSMNTGGGAAFPVGIVPTGSDLYVGIVRDSGQTGPSKPNNPNYPCCGPGGSQGGQISNARTNSQLASVNLVCTTLDACFVGNSTTLFYIANDNQNGGAGSSPANLDALAMAGGSAATYDTFSGNTVPVGLAASDTYVVWVASTAYYNSPYPPPSCTIKARSLGPNPSTTTIFQTSAFSCMGAAFDGTSVYFTIVSANPDGQTMRGDGIGRIAITGGVPESLRLGIQGETEGPRRVYLDGEDLYLVAPLVVARMKTSALDNVHDFNP